MALELVGNEQQSWNGRSPGGFEFGIQGWVYGPPIPRSITFFLDGSAMVCDQYGRPIRKAILDSGEELTFADSPPESNREGTVVPRPQFATHAQTIAALQAERYDWLAYEVRYRAKDGSQKMRGNLTMADAIKLQEKLLKEGNAPVVVDRTISCCGWPQVSYAELKKLPEVPPTPKKELLKIHDAVLRRDALKLRAETDEARDKELVGTDE